MQHQFSELLVAHKQADLQREIEQINLVREAESTSAPLQNWTNDKMHDFSVWMIRTGKRLHERYHTPSCLHQMHPRSSQAH